MHCENGVFSGISADGGFAELLKTSARAVIKLPPGVKPKYVAAHANAGLTAYHAVKKASHILYPGTRAVVMGVGGGLGYFGIQCLRAMTPAEIVAVDVSEGALKLAGECGADHLVHVDGSQVEKVRDITEGMGAEVVVDFVGENGPVEDGVAMIREAGSYYVVGYGGTLNIPTLAIISREINFIGNLIGTSIELAELNVLEAQGKVIQYTEAYPLDAVNDALADLSSGRLYGSGILIP